MRPLVDYGEDEDEDVGFPSDATIKMESDRPGSTGLTGSKLAPSPILSTAGLTLGGGPPRRIPKKEDEEDEDAILESLVRGQTPAPPGLRPADKFPVSRMTSPPRLGEKRRRGNGRGDDDDDELFSRLTRNKKQQVFMPIAASRQPQQQSKTGFIAVDSATSRQKNGTDPLKKFKVKIGGFVTARTAQAYSGSTAAASEHVLTASSPSPAPSVSASPSPAPSGSDTKDGDTG